MSVKMFIGVSSEFERACASAKTPPTRRQWKKWEKGQGIARKAHQTEMMLRRRVEQIEPIVAPVPPAPEIVMECP